MLEELLPYYERELGYLRELSGEFARRYPKIARRLSLEGDQCEDPHVERIIEAFAFLTARIHRKLDDEFPEITEAFMQVLYPHYTRPFPSCTVLQLETDPENPEIATRYTIPRHHPAISPPVGGMPCRFRTCYQVDLYPLTLQSVSLRLAAASDYLGRNDPDAAAAITLEFQTQGALPLAQLKLDKLRFFLDGEPALMHLLYELLLTRALRVRVDDGTGDPARTAILPASSLTAAGFSQEESLLDIDERTFAGFRLLAEYFAFPEKFLFIDLAGLDAPALQHGGTNLRVQILLSAFPETERHNRLAQTLDTQHFKMGCTPAINLFEHAAEPIRLTHQRAAYPVTPDGRRPFAYEVVSIDSVTCVEKNGSQTSFHDIPPFYSILHHARDAQQKAFWHSTREPSVREFDKGTDMEIAFVDLDFTPQRPDSEVLSINLTCCNRDLPTQLPFGGGGTGVHTDFTLPQIPVVKRARPLRKPTATLRPPRKRGLQWRLISHLSLNHLSIMSKGKEVLQEMLALYNCSNSQSTARQIQGITGIHSQPAVARVAGKHFTGFVRGTDVTLTVDEQAFVGAGAVLFGSVMDRFLALYAAPNSFTRLTLRSQQQEQEIARWPARTGEAIVI